MLKEFLELTDLSADCGKPRAMTVIGSLIISGTHDRAGEQHMEQMIWVPWNSVEQMIRAQILDDLGLQWNTAIIALTSPKRMLIPLVRPDGNA
jgi:hypothetical protein